MICYDFPQYHKFVQKITSRIMRKTLDKDVKVWYKTICKFSRKQKNRLTIWSRIRWQTKKRGKMETSIGPVLEKIMRVDYKADDLPAFDKQGAFTQGKAFLGIKSEFDLFTKFAELNAYVSEKEKEFNAQTRDTYLARVNADIAGINSEITALQARLAALQTKRQTIIPDTQQVTTKVVVGNRSANQYFYMPKDNTGLQGSALTVYNALVLLGVTPGTRIKKSTVDSAYNVDKGNSTRKQGTGLNLHLTLKGFPVRTENLDRITL